MQCNHHLFTTCKQCLAAARFDLFALLHATRAVACIHPLLRPYAIKIWLLALLLLLQAFSWVHHYQGHSWQEQIMVFWLAPFAGAALGGLLYRAISRQHVFHSARQLPAELKAAAAGGTGQKDD